MRLWGATSSHVGNVREVNQDRVYFRGAVAAVADGMGGHQGGERAAELAIGEFRIVRAQLSPEELVDVVEEANRQVHQQAVDPDLRGMGTTMVALSLHSDGTMTVVNVGDSRAYWLRGDTLAQITEDHSFVEDLVRQGRLSPEEAAVHPQRNILTRALGIADSVEVDRFEIDPQVGDRLLLCSDGLFNEITASEITKILSDHEDPTEAAKSLVSAALETPCRDNVSVAVVSVVAAGHPAVAGTTGDLGIDLSAPRSPSADITAKLPVVSKAGVVQMAGGAGINTLAAPGVGLSDSAGTESTGGRDLAVEMFSRNDAPKVENPPGAHDAEHDAGYSDDGSPDSNQELNGLATTTGVIDRPVGGSRTGNADGVIAPKVSRPRRRLFWPLIALLLIGGLAAAGYVAASWYNDSLHHVQTVDGELVVFQGRSGGLLWLEPVEVERSGRFLDELTEASQTTVNTWGDFDSLKDAQLSIDNLETDIVDGDQSGVEATTGAAESDGGIQSEGVTSDSTGPGSSSSNGG